MKKKPILALLLIMLIIFSTSSTYALYRGGVSGTGSVSLARWSVTLNQTGVEDHLSITPDPDGTTASYTLNITSDAEVNVIYSIVLNNLPTGISVSLDGGTYVPESNHTVTLTSDRTILYSDINKSKSHTLTFKAASGTQYVTNSEIDVNVVARQQL